VVAIEPQKAPVQPESTTIDLKVREDQIRTKEKKALFIGIYKRTLGSIKSTCEKVGIDRSVFYDWLRDDPEFSAAKKQAFKEKLEDIEELENKKMLSGDSSMIKHFLDKRHPLYKTRVVVQGPGIGEESLEEIFEKAEWQDDNVDYGNETKQPNSNTKPVQDPKQTGGGSAVQNEPGTDILLETQDKKEPNP
jgi:hypothetical protein